MIELRSDPKLNRFLHKISGSFDDQLKWLLIYFTKKNDFYFVIESQKHKTPEGLISIYNIDEMRKEAEWGRWIVKRSSLASLESAFLIYKCAFEVLNLESIYCLTVKDNERVVSFHDSCIQAKRDIKPNYFEIDNKQYDAIKHTMLKNDWPIISKKLEVLSSQIASRI